MKAVQLLGHGTPGQFQLRELPDPQPAADEVLVQVRACGLNHLDLWAEAGRLPVSISLPRTLGCEIAGVIAALGDDVDEWRVGDPVAIQSNLFCGHCEFCQRGDESLCLSGQLLGVQRDGGFAEKAVAPARSLVRLPEGVDFESSAAVTLAGSTAMHMLTDRAEVRAGDWVLVVGGASGVGSAAIQIARQFGARVIATASTEAKQTLAKKLGADFVLDSTGNDWPAEVRKITDKRGVDVVVEHVGGEVLERALTCLARGGTVVTCGATAGREARLNLWPFFAKQHRLIGSYGRNRSDLTATLEWVAGGRLKPVIDRVFPLAETADAMAQLRNRRVLGKVLVRP
jgi:NADPH:quinone reductase-like Zn-dependent oxidoreductase